MTTHSPVEDEFRMQSERTDDDTYKVLVNHADQYSICSAQGRTPAGWHEVGQQGPIEECLTYILEVVTDTRPISLREWLPACLPEDMEVSF
jgi:MbtH protein